MRSDVFQRLQQALQVSDLDGDAFFGRVKVASWPFPSPNMNNIKAARAIGAHAHRLVVLERPLVKNFSLEVMGLVEGFARSVPCPCFLSHTNFPANAAAGLLDRRSSEQRLGSSPPVANYDRVF
jgi:hypothetical protein